MEDIESKNKFIREFNIKFPNYKIIKFTNLSSELIVEDDRGYLHRKINSVRVLNSSFGIQSVINKHSFIQDKLNQLNSGLKLIEFTSVKNKVIVEDNFGFKYSPKCYDLLKGSAVSIETCSEKEKLFLFKANKKHNSFYKYSDFIYKNGKTKIDIICPIHGKFNQLIESHIFGHGCPKCNKVGFSKESWLTKVKKNKAYFYILRIYHENEEFIKIGITSKSVYDRYKRLKEYSFEVLKIVEGNASIIYDLEKEYLKEHKNLKYYPLLPFEGYTECFNFKYKQQILNYESNLNFGHS